MNRNREKQKTAQDAILTHTYIISSMPKLNWNIVRISAAALSIAVVVVCAGGVELCETTVHLPPNGIETSDTARARRIADQSNTRLEEVQVRSIDGFTLKGWFFRSSRPGAESVILLHGQGDTRRGMLGIASFLLRAGYHVLIPDARGHGDNGGMVASYGFRETTDVSRWSNWLESNAKSDCIYGAGLSMGAAILLQSLPTEPRICAAVAESPFSSFRDIGVYRTGNILGATTVLPQAFVAAGFAYARMRYGVNFDRVSPEDSIALSQTPVLLIHGTGDTNIPIAESRIIRQRRPKDTELWEVEGARHVRCYAAAGPEYETRVLAWFRKFSHLPR
jgi:alpha-beta hydrolase superfamily lysophospholipase